MRIALLLATSALTLTAGSAFAQDEDIATVETVVVTAQKREQTLQDVPIAVTALTERRLEQMGGSELRDFVEAIPGLELQGDRAGETRTSIRGISEIGGGAVSVGVYIDEIPVSTFTAEGINLKTFDVERLEILRGPQGTLYGEGSLGGAIRIITAKPSTTDFGGHFDVTGSQTEGGGSNWEVRGALNVPIAGDKAGLRIVAMKSDLSGFIDNPVLGTNDINYEESFTGRATLRLKPIDSLTVDLSYIRQEVESGGPSQGDSQNRNFAGTAQSRDDNINLWNLTANWDLGFAILTSASGWFDRSSFSNNDFTPAAGIVSFLVGAPISTVKITRPNDQEVFSQELRLVSNGDGPLQWTVGAFYKKDNLVIANSGISSPAVPIALYELKVDETAEQVAVFGEIDYAFTDKLHGVVGVRWFNEERDILASVGGLLPLALSGASVSNLPISSSEDKVTPKFSVYYQATDRALVYATASAGFRAGGINPNSFIFPGAPFSFGPESLWNYEVGAKTIWMDGRLTVNAALYDIEWDDVIVNAATANPLFGYSINGGKAHSRGAELEILAVPMSGLLLDVSGNVTNAEIDEANPGTVAAAGRKLPFVPEYKLHAGAQYTFPLVGELEGRVRMDVTRTGESYSGIDNAAVGLNDAYTKVDLRVSLLQGPWELTAFADNLGDERGELRSFAGGQALITTPRTIGLTLRGRF